MNILEVNFNIPVPWPHLEHPNFSRVIKQGKNRNPVDNQEIEFLVFMKDGFIHAVDVSSGDQAAYPLSVVSRIRYENE